MPIRERNGKWHYRFWINGVEYTGSTELAATERNKTAALRVEAKARELVLQGKSDQLKLQVIPFGDAARAFLAWVDGEYRKKPSSAKRIRTSFATLLPYFERFAVTAITPGRVDDYKSWRRTEHQVREVTIRHDLHALSLFFQYAERHNWVRENVVRKVEIPSDQDAERFHEVTPGEEMAYFAMARTRFTLHKKKLTKPQKCGPFDDLYDMGRIMIQQGCRPEEVLGLEKKSIDLKAAKFRVEFGKSKAAKRSLKMTPEVRTILEKRMATAGPWIFPSPRVRGQHITKLNGSHDDVLQATGLSFVPYDFRHTFATRMARAGMPLPVLKAIMGHANLRTIMRYVHINEADTDAAMSQYAGAVVVVIPEADGAGTVQ